MDTNTILILAGNAVIVIATVYTAFGKLGDRILKLEVQGSYAREYIEKRDEADVIRDQKVAGLSRAVARLEGISKQI